MEGVWEHGVACCPSLGMGVGGGNASGAQAPGTPPAPHAGDWCIWDDLLWRECFLDDVAAACLVAAAGPLAALCNAFNMCLAQSRNDSMSCLHGVGAILGEQGEPTL